MLPTELRITTEFKFYKLCEILYNKMKLPYRNAIRKTKAAGMKITADYDKHGFFFTWHKI